MIYKEEMRNLLEVPAEYVVAHNIDSGEVALGAGVALALCKKHSNLRNACKEYANANSHEVGRTFRFVDGENIVYNMFTKPHVYFNAQNGMTMKEYLKNQEDCLNMLKRHMVFHKETKLAIPKIACGLDRCNWTDIKELLEKVFSDTDFEILVCYI